MQNPVNMVDPTGMFSDPPGEAEELFAPDMPSCGEELTLNGVL